MFHALASLFGIPKGPIAAEESAVKEYRPSLSWFKWTPTSIETLELQEQKMLSFLKKPFTLNFTTIPSPMGETAQCNIRTLLMDVDPEKKDSTPLVILHGLGAGIGFWILNLDDLSQQGPVYALDMLGFGMSSRPKFSSDATQAESQFVESIESWREEMKLEKFILMGHSMGGYVASSYATKYPERISHLILADPWGFPKKDGNASTVQFPFWVRCLAKIAHLFNPLAALRAAGPWGPQVIPKLRPDLQAKFAIITEDPRIICDYAYHSNAQSPSGEVAFKSLSSGFGWAKFPMAERIVDMNETVPITFLYGSRSWVDCHVGYNLMEKRQNVTVNVISGAGHHLYADQPYVFNTEVLKACLKINTFTFKCDERFINTQVPNRDLDKNKEQNKSEPEISSSS